MTDRNREHTGVRKLSRLSATVRDIPDCRNLDLDMTFYCPHCGEFTIFIEIKPTQPDSWIKARDLARKHRCFGVLAVERTDSTDLFTYCAPSGSYRPPQFDLDDSQVRIWLEKLHQEHTC